MEKRVVLFLVISLGIIIGYNFLLERLGYTPLSNSPILDEPSPTGSSADSSGPGLAHEIQDLPNPPASGNVPSRSTLPTQEEVPAAQVETVETPLLTVKLTNVGAQIASWRLKNYLSQTDDPAPVELIYPEGQFPGPLALTFGDQELTRILQGAVYAVERDFSTLDSSHPSGRVILTYESPDQRLWLRKSLTFHYDSYIVDVQIESRGLPEHVEVVLGTNFGVVEWGQGFIGLLGPAWKIGEEMEKETPEPELRRTGDIRWAALQDKYFISVLIPDGANEVFAKTEAERVVSLAVGFPTSPGSSTQRFRLYAGPKQFDSLKRFGIGLEDTIDFGWFIYGSWTIVKAVAKPLFYVLRFLYEYTHNYGLAIILLTVGIKLLFVPLQYKSYKSMQGMQKVQPKVVEIQNKYKDDRERLNKELMKLYREHKVNPVGGCLPMFLQMPVFVALFNILYMTVDLRQAPFILWISDLSVPDPYYVLPILMGVSMVVQQKIMPTTMDPTQAKMMLMLPVFLTFLFLTFPAGLVLYWITNNVLTIAQQFVTDRYIFKRSTFTSASRPVAGPPGVDPEARAAPQADGDESPKERHRVVEGKGPKAREDGDHRNRQVQAAVRDLEAHEEELRKETTRQVEAVRALQDKAGSLLARMTPSSQEEGSDAQAFPSAPSGPEYRELAREVQQGLTRQKTARKALRRKVQKTLDKVHDVDQAEVGEAKYEQLEKARQKVKAAQEELATVLAQERGTLEKTLQEIRDALGHRSTDSVD